MVVLEWFWILIVVVVVTQLYTFIKTNRPAHQKGLILLYVNYTLIFKYKSFKLNLWRKINQ